MENGQLDLLGVIWSSGIVVKLVLMLLCIGSIISWAVVFKKRRLLKKVTKLNEDFLVIYNSSSNLKEVMDKTVDMSFSPFHQMFLRGHQELTGIRSCFSNDRMGEGLIHHFKDFGMHALERALKKGANESNEILEKSLSFLASIGAISPFIGLFGTVWGIINSFTGIAGGGATLDAVAPGIAEALVATAVGLFVAIPAVWFFNHFTNRFTEVNGQMESFGQDFLNNVERSLAGSRG